MVEIKIHLYRFSELCDIAKQKAIMDHRVFMINTLEPDYIDGVTDWNDPEKMEMYWADCADIIDNDETVVESIEVNEYWFFYNGVLANTQTHLFDDEPPKTTAIVYGELVEVTAE